MQVAKLENRSTCQFNGITFKEGEKWEFSKCHSCTCEVGITIQAEIFDTIIVNIIETLCYYAG